MSVAHIKVRSQNSFHMDITREIASLEGHLFALPIIFINLGGEMIYVIEHRLRAQSLEDRLDKVMQDVIGTIFRPRIIDELFKPQHLLSESSMRSLFQKLAHASIMSLNQESMDKLLDLMTMTVKFQMFNCRYPMEMIYCTLNHLDYMRDMVKHVEPISNSLRKVYNHIERTYGRMDLQNLVLLRQTTLRFFQDRKTRLSVFLTGGYQKETDGSMRIPPEYEIAEASMVNLPGKITFYKTTKGVLSKETTEARAETFSTGGFFTVGPKVTHNTSFDMPMGNRGTKLGQNVFAAYKGPNIANAVSRRSSNAGNAAAATKTMKPPETNEDDWTMSAAGAAEIAMLQRILGGATDLNDQDSSQSSTTIELDFMPDSEEKEEPSNATATVVLPAVRATQVVRVEFSKDKLKGIDLGLQDVGASSSLANESFDGLDLLQLMDEAAGK